MGDSNWLATVNINALKNKMGPCSRGSKWKSALTKFKHAEHESWLGLWMGSGYKKVI
jgi:hypothetical protein